MGFIITINDGFCTWEYDFDISDDYSIDDVVNKLSKGFGIEEPKGKLI